LRFLCRQPGLASKQPNQPQQADAQGTDKESLCEVSHQDSSSSSWVPLRLKISSRPPADSAATTPSPIHSQVISPVCGTEGAGSTGVGVGAGCSGLGDSGLYGVGAGASRMTTVPSSIRVQ